MELLVYLRIVLRRWWLVAIPVVITAALAIPDLIRQAPAASGGYSTVISYTAAQPLEAIERPAGDYQDLWLASELAVNAFTEWVRGSSFADEIGAALAARGETFDVSTFRAGADNERSVGQIFLNWPDADQLALIADAAVQVLETRSGAYFAQLGGQPAPITILDRSPISAAPPPLTDRFGPFIRIGLGLLAGIALAFLAHYLDPVLRSREEVEALGLPVIARIPRR